MSSFDEPSFWVLLTDGDVSLIRCSSWSHGVMCWWYLGHVTVGPCGSMVLYVPKSIFLTLFIKTKKNLPLCPPLFLDRILALSHALYKFKSPLGFQARELLYWLTTATFSLIFPQLLGDCQSFRSNHQYSIPDLEAVAEEFSGTGSFLPN